MSLATDEPLSFEITPKEPFEQVEVRPKALHIQPEISDGVIRFTLPKAAYFTVEPYGRRNALHIFADPFSQYVESFDNPSVIYYGRGIHDAGIIELKSDQTLFLDEGAVVYACVHATDAENIRILGRGVLDNSKNREQILFPANAEYNEKAINNCIRQHTIQLEYCTNVEIEGITIRDSLVYNIRPIGCKNLSIANVKIIGCWRYNSDGIDMHNCENVTIDNCFIRTFDDSICIKGFDCYYEGDIEQAVHNAMYRNGKSYDVFRNVRVSHCVIWNDWGRCLEIGAETRAKEICDVIFEDCDIIHVTMDVLDCQNVDYADVHDIVWRNICIEYDDVIPSPLLQNTDREKYQLMNADYAPSTLCAVVIFHPEYSAGGAKRGINRNILFENIRLYGRQKPIFCFQGYNETAACENITIRNFFYNGKRLKKQDPYDLEVNAFCRNCALELEE